MTRERIKIEGMGCQHCVHAVSAALEKLDVDIHNVEIGSVEITYDDAVDRKQVDAAISEAGYQAVSHEQVGAPS